MAQPGFCFGEGAELNDTKIIRKRIEYERDSDYRKNGNIFLENMTTNAVQLDRIILVEKKRKCGQIFYNSFIFSKTRRIFVKIWTIKFGLRITPFFEFVFIEKIPNWLA